MGQRVVVLSSPVFFFSPQLAPRGRSSHSADFAFSTEPDPIKLFPCSIVILSAPSLDLSDF